MVMWAGLTVTSTLGSLPARGKDQGPGQAARTALTMRSPRPYATRACTSTTSGSSWARPSRSPKAGRSSWTASARPRYSAQPDPAAAHPVRGPRRPGAAEFLVGGVHKADLHRPARTASSGTCCALTTDEDIRAAEREQWDDGTNYLAVASGVIVGGRPPASGTGAGEHPGRDHRRSEPGLRRRPQPGLTGLRRCRLPRSRVCLPRPDPPAPRHPAEPASRAGIQARPDIPRIVGSAGSRSPPPRRP
jgi:hypothetical protein